MADEPSGKGDTRTQLLGSLAVAALIVGAALWAVTAKLGPTSIAEQEAAEERAEEAAEEQADGSGRRRRGRDR